MVKSLFLFLEVRIHRFNQYQLIYYQLTLVSKGKKTFPHNLPLFYKLKKY